MKNNKIEKKYPNEKETFAKKEVIPNKQIITKIEYTLSKFFF